MNTAIIINPISGKRLRGIERIERVRALVEQLSLKDVVIWQTERAGHATELAQAAVDEGFDRVVCIGGDGTINEVAKVLIGRSVEFGIVPMGSGNGLARFLGLPLGFNEALERAITGRNIRQIDTGEANGHAFFNVMGLGFDAELGRRFNEVRTGGFWSYFKIGVRTLFDYRSVKYEIEANGRTDSLEAYVVAIANSSQYGSNAFIAPDASIDDGKLNLVTIKPTNPLRAFVVGLRMFNRSIYESPLVHGIEANTFVLRLPKAGFFHVDGEIFECDEVVNVRTLPCSLRVVA